jgi:zinc/manganese transport system substrate-binding protein
VAKLLSANSESDRASIVAADLVGKKPGDNPTSGTTRTMPAVAKALADRLDVVDPANKPDYDANLQTLDATLQRIADKAAAITAKYAGAEVTATEQVFGYMAAALGLKMRNERFQLAVMNGTEPSAHDTAAMVGDLKGRKAKVFFYNSQVTDPLADRLLKIANAANIPVVGVSETQPAGKTFAEWMLSQLDATEKALAAPPS